MSELKAKMVEIMQGAKVARVGSTIYIYDEDSMDRIEKVMHRKAMQTGEVIEQGGTKIWYAHEVVFDPSKQGSARYVWDKSGNFVKTKVVRYTNEPGKPQKEEFVRFAYEVPD